MHIVSKFQFFMHIFSMVKLKKNESKVWKGGKKRGKMASFCHFFKMQYLRKLLSYKLNTYFKMLLTILAITYVKFLWLF